MKNSHANGCRYLIKGLYDHVIDVVVATSIKAGKSIFIPLINLIPTDTIYLFHRQRKQFPVQPAYAITAN